MIFWGNRANAHGQAPTGAVFGHIDDWEEAAIDYVDGLLDPAATLLVERHLSSCPECAARIRRQQATTVLLRQTSLEQPPAYLEDEVLGRVLFPRPADRPVPLRAAKEPARLPALRRPRVTAWIPAAAAVAVILVAMVVYGVVRSGAGAPDEGVATTTAAAVTTAASTEEVATLEANDSAPMDQYTATTGAPGTTEAAAVAAAGPPETEAGGAALKALRPFIEDRDGMVQGLSNAAGAPACIVFEGLESPAPDQGENGVPVTSASQVSEIPPAEDPDSREDTESSGDATSTTVAGTVTGDEATDLGDGATVMAAEQANDLAAQITSLTGLQPLDIGPVFGGPVFAAYVPLEDTEQFIDLLFDIGDSLGLSVSLVPQPDPAAGWLAPVLDRQAELVALTASRTPKPSVSSWSFTTSSLPEVEEVGGESGADGESTDTTATTAEESSSAARLAATHVLVVILMNATP